MTAKYGSQVVHFKYPATDRNCIDICKEKDLFLLVSCRIHGAEGQSSSRYNIKENESQKKRGKRVAKEWNQEWPPHPKRKWRSQAQWVLVTSRSCLKSFCRQPLSSIISFHFSFFWGCWLFTPPPPYRPLFFFWKINDRPIPAPFELWRPAPVSLKRRRMQFSLLRSSDATP